MPGLLVGAVAGWARPRADGLLLEV
ncbi:MAG: hypothetical protein JWN88_493, partial [Frankiales bacterium]|nr:hypothetical protein [Frankiales bacterium]